MADKEEGIPELRRTRATVICIEENIFVSKTGDQNHRECIDFTTMTNGSGMRTIRVYGDKRTAVVAEENVIAIVWENDPE